MQVQVKYNNIRIYKCFKKHRQCSFIFMIPNVFWSVIPEKQQQNYTEVVVKQQFKLYCSYICRTDPADVARVESKTWMCTKEKYQTVPHTAPGTTCVLGQWKSPEDAQACVERYNGCMAGKEKLTSLHQLYMS